MTRPHNCPRDLREPCSFPDCTCANKQATDARVCPYCEGGTVPHLVHGIPCRCPACGQLPTRATDARVRCSSYSDGRKERCTLHAGHDGPHEDSAGVKWPKPGAFPDGRVPLADGLDEPEQATSTRAGLAQALADAYGPVGRVDEMPRGERQTFLDMADAAVSYLGTEDA